ncbi:hypothetical protein ACN2XU_02370 [Primorskyibacter sp. 2E107]|uniref:hypothetical protein n=1 Tax=Primorskyibacter sp. 2E107 TaxID=3403458 RepID=UPI003AF9296F
MSERRKDGHTRGRGFAFGTALAVLLPGMALANDPLIPREACEPIFSVQTRNCSVQHVFSCEGGSLFRRETWQQDEAFTVEEMTARGLTQYLWHEHDGMIMDGILDQVKPYDLPAALDAGTHAYEGVSAFRTPFFLEPIPARFVGVLEATGESVTLDGVTFDVVEDKSRGMVNAVMIEGTYTLYVDRASGVAIEGPSTGTIFNVTMEDGGVPMKVIRPGEAGFGENVGLYDCGAVS